MKAHDNMKLVMAGDIGGTKTNIGLFSAGQSRPSCEVEKSYSSQDVSSLQEVIEQFLDEHPEPVSSACFGIAGPVIKGESKTTNLPWVVSEETIKERFEFGRVRLINDLAATAMSVPALLESEVHKLNTCIPEKGGAIGIVAPGTGLGIALAVFKEGSIHTVSSEGGHVDFAPRNEREIDLLRHLLDQLSHVSIERVVSGPGLFAIYSWLREYRDYREPDWLAEKMTSEDEAPKVISQTALADKDPLCVEALDLFASIMGAVAGNLALTGMTTGGIYLGGGIPPKIVQKLDDGTFMEAFTAKGRFRDLLSTIPVRVILNDKAALLGAACCALELEKRSAP
jgi:glucokinase